MNSDHTILRGHTEGHMSHNFDLSPVSKFMSNSLRKNGKIS